MKERERVRAPVYICEGVSVCVHDVCTAAVLKPTVSINSAWCFLSRAFVFTTGFLEHRNNQYPYPLVSYVLTSSVPSFVHVYRARHLLTKHYLDERIIEKALSLSTL